MKKALVPVPVEFNNSTIFMVVHKNEPYVPMKPIVEGMGLDWRGQQAKIRSSQRYGDITIPLETPGGIQDMLCIHLKKLNGWLYSVNPEKVKPEIKAIIIMYQEESTQVLYEYWNNGFAANPRKGGNNIGYFEMKSREFCALKKIAKNKKLPETDAIKFAAKKMKEKYGDPESLFGTAHLNSPQIEYDQDNSCFIKYGEI